jgi:hypothetical protein
MKAHQLKTKPTPGTIDLGTGHIVGVLMIAGC